FLDPRPDRERDSFSLTSTKPVFHFRMCRNILEPVRAPPYRADDNEITKQRSHQRHAGEIAGLAAESLDDDRSSRKKHRRPKTRAHQWLDSLIQYSKEVSF